MFIIKHGNLLKRKSALMDLLYFAIEIPLLVIRFAFFANTANCKIGYQTNTTEKQFSMMQNRSTSPNLSFLFSTFSVKV